MLSVERNPKWSIERTLNIKGKNRAVAFAILCLATLSSVNLAAQKQDDAELLRARETVWRAWFAGDTNTPKELVPPETIVTSGGEEQWKHQADVLRTSVSFMREAGNSFSLSFLAPRFNTLATSPSFAELMH